MANEVPSDDTVVATLADLGGRATALELCRALIAAGNDIGDSQLAIQRTSERGRIAVEPDWSLTLVREPLAA